VARSLTCTAACWDSGQSHRSPLLRARIDFLLFICTSIADPWPAFNVADSCISIAVSALHHSLFPQAEENWRSDTALPEGADASRRALRFAQRSGYSDASEILAHGKGRARSCARLRERGHIAYFAGGCVRDMVRGLSPKDYDIATDARPEVCRSFSHARSRSARILA
jgi:hypothetical protein